MSNEDNKSVLWPKLRLGALLKRVVNPVTVKKDDTYRQIGIRSHCKGIFYKPEVTGKQLGDKRVFWIEPNCLILNIVFAWEHAVAMTTATEQGMIASHRFPMYAARNGNLLPEYAYIYFSSPRGKYDLGIASPGGAGRNKTLGGEEFNRLKISVPPIAHQKIAINILNTWSTAITQTERLISAKQKIKKGLMQQLLTGKKRFSGFKSKWVTVRIDEICNISIGGTPARKNQKYWAEFGDGHPWLSIRDMADTWVKSTSEAITDEGVKYSNVKLIPRGTTLMSFKLTIGKVARAGIDLYTNEAIAAFFPKDKKVSDEFLFLCLPYAAQRTATDQAIKGATLNKEKLSSMLFKLPPINEQMEIAKMMDLIELDLSGLRKILNMLKEQKRGLMQKLLTGQVRVKGVWE